MGRRRGGRGRMPSEITYRCDGPWADVEDDDRTPPSHGKTKRTNYKLSQLVRWHRKVAAPGDSASGSQAQEANAENYVKVHAVRFDITENCCLAGKHKQLKDLPEYLRCVRFLKLGRPSGVNTQDLPETDYSMKLGDRVWVRFERPDRKNVVQVSSGEDVNKLLKEHAIGDFFETTKHNNNLQVADKRDKWFDVVVKELCLNDVQANLKLESFDCLELTYPEEAHPGWIGAPIGIWKNGSGNIAGQRAAFSSTRDIPDVSLELHGEVVCHSEVVALNCRYNFPFTPSMVCRELANPTRREYFVPAIPSTIILPGDKILFLPPWPMRSTQNEASDAVEVWSEGIIHKWCDKDYINGLDRHDK